MPEGLPRGGGRRLLPATTLPVWTCNACIIHFEVPSLQARRSNQHTVAFYKHSVNRKHFSVQPSSLGWQTPELLCLSQGVAFGEVRRQPIFLAGVPACYRGGFVAAGGLAHICISCIFMFCFSMACSCSQQLFFKCKNWKKKNRKKCACFPDNNQKASEATQPKGSAFSFSPNDEELEEIVPSRTAHLAWKQLSGSSFPRTPEYAHHTHCSS